MTRLDRSRNNIRSNNSEQTQPQSSLNQQAKNPTQDDRNAALTHPDPVDSRGEGWGESGPPMARTAAPDVITLTIMAPTEWINTNKRYHPMAKAKLTRAWREAGRIAAHGMKPLTPPVHIVAYIWKPRAGRYDPNNLADTSKACVDGLIDAGVLPDDSFREVIGPDHRHGGKGTPSLVLTIREL